MKNQLLAEMTRQMLPHLDNAQIEQLQNVLRHCLWNVEVTESRGINFGYKYPRYTVCLLSGF